MIRCPPSHFDVQFDWQYRVRPFPDPERKEATEFMSKKEIEAEALKDSRK